jgi:hypothetical protein
MRIPPKIRITNKISYEILWVKEFHDCPDTLGECRPTERQIVLKVDQSPEELCQTFIHEILHALCLENRKLKLKHKDIYALEAPLFKFLRLNKFI